MATAGRGVGGGPTGWLVVVAGAVLGLSACGGGSNSPGGSPNPPPTVQPPPPVGPPPGSPTPPPGINIHLDLTGAGEAHDAGLTGAGLRVAVVDSGVMRNHPSLAGRVVENQVYVSGQRNNLNVDDVVGHGTWIAQVIGGQPFGQYGGGIAPGVEFVSARIIGDQRPTDDGSGQGNQVGVSDAQFFGFLNDQLRSAGALIMNNSWGGLYWNDQAVTQAFYDAYRPFIFNHGGLVVFATGNSSFDDPTNTAALPSKHPVAAPLERGWLAVAALDGDNPNQLAAYSNACGVAMNYCLVAPGRLVVTSHDDTAGSPTYLRLQGTSLAAPQVTGAAALVWEAFPWFNNDLVRQTLLGTATDMGEPGPDPVFGYGLLNVAKAVRGPGRFDWGDVVADFSGTYRWGNAIQGEGGLVKRGPGTLVLGALDAPDTISSYAGDTRVEAGRLVFDQSGLSESLLQVADGGRVDLRSARFGRSVEVDGWLDLVGGESLIQGDLALGGDGRLGVRLGATLTVEGDLRIADQARLHVLGTTTGYVSSDEERVVRVFGVIDGAFADLSVEQGVFFEGRIDYRDDGVWLEIDRIDVSAAGLRLGAAASGSAARLDGAFAELDRRLAGQDGATPELAAFLDGAGRFQRVWDPELAELSVASLSGEIHATQLLAILSAVDAGSGAVRDRLSVRLEATGPGTAGAWSSRVGGLQALARSGWSSASLSHDGVVVGSDLPLGAQGVAGFSLGQSSLDTGLDGLGGHSRAQVDEAALYAGWRQGAFYGQARVAQGRVNQMVQRRVLLGDSLAELGSRYRVGYRALDAEFGLMTRRGGTGLRPFIASQRVSLGHDGFSEQGAFGFGLVGDDLRRSHWQASAGLALSQDFTAGGARNRLTARAQRQHVLDADGGQQARFAGLEVFAPLEGMGLDETTTRVDLGLESWFGEGLRLRFGLERTLDAYRRDGRAELGLDVRF